MSTPTISFDPDGDLILKLRVPTYSHEINTTDESAGYVCLIHHVSLLLTYH